MKLLYINACVRKESRTDKIARALIKKTGEGYEVEELKLSGLNLTPLNEERLNKRYSLIASQSFDDPEFLLANQLARADIIVISAPYWDGSFPSLLKLYIENIYITGIVSKYSEQGIPVGLCKGKMLYYVTTAGGPYNSTYSYDHIRDLAINCLGIKETKLIKAEMLDVIGFDADKIVADTIANL